MLADEVFLPAQNLGDIGFVEPDENAESFFPIISALSGGGYVATWSNRTDEGRDIYSRIFDTDGLPLGDPFRINHEGGNNQNFVAAALEDGGFVVVWYSFFSGQGFSSVYDAEGELVSGPTLYGTNSVPGVVALNDGGFLVLSSQLEVEATRYNADGDQIGESFIVSSSPFNNAQEFGGVQLANGTIVIVWDDFRDPDNSLGVAYRLYDNDLNALSEAMSINQNIEGLQWQTDVVELADGGFVVTWETWGLNVSEDFLSFRVYDEDGNPITDEIIVNTPVASFGTQNISITATDDGGFALAWSDADRQFYFRQFDELGNAVTNQTQLNEGSSSRSGQVDIATLEDGTAVAIWTADRIVSVRSVEFVTEEDGFTITGRSGDDSAIGGTGNDTLLGLAGNDTLSGGNGADTLDGGDGDDDLFGGNQPDVLIGGNGRDTLRGSNGADTLSGGTGFDDLSGGNGNDLLQGDGAGDRLRGDPGADTLNGGAGSTDQAYYFFSNEGVNVNLETGEASGGYAEGDVITNVESVIGSTGDDTLTGLSNTAGRLAGAGGDDMLTGGNRNDRLEGGNGNDTLIGGAGDDQLTGGRGDDVLTGGAGDDTLRGNTGADTFIFSSGSGDDVIIGFRADDTLDLSESTTDFTSLADVQAAATETDAGLLIDLGGGDTLLLQGVSLDDLVAASLAL